MPELTVEKTYKADVAENEKLDSQQWVPAESEAMTPAHPEDLQAMSLTELACLVVDADELEPYGRT